MKHRLQPNSRAQQRKKQREFFEMQKYQKVMQPSDNPLAGASGSKDITHLAIVADMHFNQSTDTVNEKFLIFGSSQSNQKRESKNLSGYRKAFIPPDHNCSFNTSKLEFDRGDLDEEDEVRQSRMIQQVKQEMQRRHNNVDGKKKKRVMIRLPPKDSPSSTIVHQQFDGLQTKIEELDSSVVIEPAAQRTLKKSILKRKCSEDGFDTFIRPVEVMQKNRMQSCASDDEIKVLKNVKDPYTKYDIINKFKRNNFSSPKNDYLDQFRILPKSSQKCLDIDQLRGSCEIDKLTHHCQTKEDLNSVEEELEITNDMIEQHQQYAGAVQARQNDERGDSDTSSEEDADECEGCQARLKLLHIMMSKSSGCLLSRNVKLLFELDCCSNKYFHNTIVSKNTLKNDKSLSL